MKWHITVNEYDVNVACVVTFLNFDVFRYITDHCFSKISKLTTSPTRNDEQVVERYQSVAAFTSSGRGEMSLKENEVVTVIEKNNTGLYMHVIKI